MCGVWWARADADDMIKTVVLADKAHMGPLILPANVKGRLLLRASAPAPNLANCLSQGSHVA